jgi:hypothetical protein
MRSVESANLKNFRKTGNKPDTKAEPIRPWWNDECKQLSDVETTFQPALDGVYVWSRKWKFNFALAKSTIVIFT